MLSPPPLSRRGPQGAPGGGVGLHGEGDDDVQPGLGHRGVHAPQVPDLPREVPSAPLAEGPSPLPCPCPHSKKTEQTEILFSKEIFYEPSHPLLSYDHRPAVSDQGVVTRHWP